MIKPQDLPKKVRDNVIVQDLYPNRSDAGWWAPNSVIVRDVVPTYTIPGGGITSSDITDLPKAIKKCKKNLQQHIAHCNMLIDKYDDLYEIVTNGR